MKPRASSHSSRRRVFLLRAAACSAGLAAAVPARAARVDESDEAATALGYRHDASQVDTKKYPQYAVGQRCASCAFWQGASGDEWSGCSMFGRKHIAAGGWCIAWRKP
ncbi:high-potential iron-sulfur protein [Ideonella sp. DXS29W]|uniref:High-potential iron-sulfur protein n=1 Tax=Ideonella lacteola TaxID=2984193 RepID=A0ABU9BV82_9BURK